MADATSSGIVDGNSSSGGEESDEVIEKLFPKCALRTTRINRHTTKVNKSTNKPRESSNSSDSLPVSTSTQEGDDVTPSLAGNGTGNHTSPTANNNNFGNRTQIRTNYHNNTYQTGHNKTDLNLYLLSFSPVKSTTDHITIDNVNMNREDKPSTGVDFMNMNGGGTFMTPKTEDVNVAANQESKADETDASSLRNRVDNVLVSPTEDMPAWTTKKQYNHHHHPHQNNHHRGSGHRRSKKSYRHKNTHNKVVVMDEDDESSHDSMRDDSSSPSISLRSSINHRKGKKCKKSSNKFKVRSVPVSSEDDIAIKMTEGDVMDTDLSSSSPGQEPEIARVIGNIPIPVYEGSPRRYGPKQPGSSQRIFPNEYDRRSNDPDQDECTSKDLDSLDFRPTFIDISCDELVKSILSIPLPSALESSGDSSKSPGAVENNIHEHPEKQIDSSVATISHEDEPGNETKLEIEGKQKEEKGGETEEIAAGSVNPKEDPVTNHENELILLHQRVHQHLLQELTSGAVSTKSTSKEYPLKSGPSKNFTLSPETTDCDSNDVGSEYSLSSGSRLIHLPILEDGLSSGLPSPDDTEYDDAPPLSSSKDRGNSGSKSGPKLKKSSSHNGGSGPSERCLRSSNYNGVSLDLDGKKQVQPAKGTGAVNINNKGHINRQDNHNSDQIPPGSSRNVNIDDEESSIRFLNEYQDKSFMGPSSRMRRSRSLQLNSDSVGSEDQKSNDPQQVVSNDSSPRRGAGGGKSSEQTEGPLNDDNNKLVRSRKGLREDECDTDQETDRLLGAQRGDERPPSSEEKGATSVKRKNASREGRRHDPKVLIEGVLFRARYLGSTQLICEGQPTKATRMMQAEEAVSRIKSLAPEGETQPSTEVDLFISTEKIMVLNTDLKEIMMDHSLRTISYIADIGDLLVLMARRRLLTPGEEKEIKRIPKMICHVFESEEAQFIAQSIGQAFQVAYMEFLKANGIEDSSFVKEMDYQEVLNSQEIFGDELEMFAKKDKQKEVIVPKQKNEILGMVIVESGWGSMLPTVVIANMAPGSPSARCGHLNIGDQIIAINGVSLVGLPLSTCQNYVKSTKTQTAVKLTVVPCAPVVEVKIKRPDTKYQLGFSVQNGVICSLLRGGIAERGGVRVGHRIIEINGQSVVAVPHERIVNLLATSVGEITMKTMPTSMFRLLTGQEAPQYM